MALNTDTLLARHAAYLPTHTPFPSVAQLAAEGKFPRVLLVTCADPRCEPSSFLSIHAGEIVTLRNAGGNVATALPNILALDTLINFTEVMVVKHTDCGSGMFTESGVKEVLRDRAGEGYEREIEKLEVGSMSGTTVEEALREQVGVVKGSKLVREEVKGGIRGFVFDIVGGGLTEVEV